MNRDREWWIRVLDLSTLCFSPESDLLKAMASTGWCVTVEHSAEGFWVGYAHTARKCAGSGVAPAFADAVINAVHDVIDLERLVT